MIDSPQGWPALMDLQTAGSYLNLKPGPTASLLRREDVAPVDVGPGAKRWRRSDLDALIARLPTINAPADADSCAAAREGVDWALAAVERRAAAPRRPAKRTHHEVRQSHPAP